MKEKLRKSFGATLIGVFCALIVGVFFGGYLINEKTAASNSAVFAVPNINRINDDLTSVQNTSDWNEYATLSCVSDGSYSVDNPYKIASASDLIKMAYLINESEDTSWCSASYKMVNHIDLSRYNWIPMGTDDKPFCGTFDGSGYSIYGLSIVDNDISEEKYAGLFGKISLPSGTHGVIKQLGLKDTIIVTARNYVGAMAGYVKTTHAIDDEWQGYEDEEEGGRAYSQVNFEHISFAIEDCYNVGYIQGGRRVGGMVGFIENAAIFNCYCYGMEQLDGLNIDYDVYSVSTSSVAIGGLVGATNPNGSVTNILNTITVMRVGVSEECTNFSRGHVIGSLNVEDIYDYTERYGYNFYANDLEDFVAEEELGTGASTLKLTNTNKSSSPYKNAFNLRRQELALLTGVTGDIVWKDQRDTVWFASQRYNKGLPILWNVPQLIKISFVVRDNGEDIFTSTGESTDLAGAALQTYEFYDRKTHSYIYEQGKTNFDAFNMQINLDGNRQYVFSSWEYEYMPTVECVNLTNNNLPPDIFQNEKSVGYACHDAKIVCNVNLKPYTIKVTATNVSEIYIDDEVIAIKNVIYKDKVKLAVTLNDGYVVSGFAVYGVIYEIDSTYFDSEDDYFEFNLITYLNSADYLGESDILEIAIFTSLKSVKVTITSNTPDASLINVYYADDEDNKAPAFCIEQSMPYGTILNLVAEVASTQSVYEFANWTVELDGVLTDIAGAGLLTFDYTLGSFDTVVISANIGKHQVKLYGVCNTYVGGDVDILINEDGDEVISSRASYDYDSEVLIRVTPRKGYDYKGLKLYKKMGEDLFPMVADGETEFYARYTTTGVHQINIVIASFAVNDNYDYDLVYDLVCDAKIYDCIVEVVYLDILGNVLDDISTQSQIGFVNDDVSDPNPTNETNIISLTGAGVRVTPAINNTNSYDTLAEFSIDYADLVGFEFYDISAIEEHEDNTTTPVGLNVNSENTYFSFNVEGKTIVTLTIKERGYQLKILGSNKNLQGKTFDDSFIKVFDKTSTQVDPSDVFTYKELTQMQVQISLPVGFEFCDNSLKMNNAIQEAYQFNPNTNQLRFNVVVNGNEDCTYTFDYQQKVVKLEASVIGVSDVEIITFGVDSSQVSIQGNVKSINIYSGQSAVVGIVEDKLPRHYEFAYWTVNGVNYGNDITLILGNVKENTIIRAVLKPVQYKLDVKVGRFVANGYLSDDEVGGVDRLSVFTYGEPVAISVEENDGFAFVGWYVEETTQEEDNPIVFSQNLTGVTFDTEQSTKTYNLLTNDFTLQFSLLTADATVYAIFQPVNKLMARVGQKGAGKVTITEQDDIKCPMSKENYYFQNSKLLLTPVPNENWEFGYWLISGQMYETKSLNYVLTENTVIDVYFKPVYSLNIVSSNDRYGQVEISRQQNDSNQVVLKAIPQANCSFVGWVVEGIMVSHNPNFNMYLNSDIEVEAKFKKEFNWNVVIVIIGCLIFVIVMIALSSYYIQRREEEPMKVRILLNSKDDKEVLQKKSKRNIYRDIIEPVPTRKIAKKNVAPIPVRKINVAPMTHKGEVITRQKTEKEED